MDINRNNHVKIKTQKNKCTFMGREEIKKQVMSVYGREEWWTLKNKNNISSCIYQGHFVTYSYIIQRIKYEKMFKIYH